MITLLTFRKNYALLAAVLFITEILIAAFVTDRFVRPYFGDVLVVILIYCLLRSFLNLSFIHIACFTLLFAYSIELLQYFSLVERLGLAQSKLARIVIGASFSWADLICYTAGIAFVLTVEKLRDKRKISSSAL